jgi:Putative adhesin
MDVPGIPRPMLVVLIAATVLLLAVGGSWALSWATRHTDTSTRTMPAAATIVVDSQRSGDVEVVGSDRADIRLTTKQRRSVFGRPKVGVRYDGERLRLDGHCSNFELWGIDAACGVTFRLEVPRDTAVRLAANSGDVTADDLAGAADLRTRSGDVDAVDVLGDLHLETISGDVDADASSSDIDASTTSGDIDVRARNPKRVRAHTISGDVHVSVPDRTYAVETHEVSGDDDVEVRKDANAPRRIEASTTSGDVNVLRDG